MQSRPRGCMYATWRLFSFCRTPCARRHARVCKARCVACCARMLVCMCASARTCVLTLLRRRVCALTIALHDVRACTAMDCLAQETALNKRSTCRRCPVRADGALLGQTVPCSGRRCPYSNIFFFQPTTFDDIASNFCRLARSSVVPSPDIMVAKRTPVPCSHIIYKQTNPSYEARLKSEHVTNHSHAKED